MKSAWLLSAAVLLILAGCGDDTTAPVKTWRATAALSVGPARGTIITDFRFNAGGSTGASGDPLSYRWDWQGDGVWDTDWSAAATATHRFAAGDTFTVRVEVRDGAVTDTADAQAILDTRHGQLVESMPISGPSVPTGIAFDGTAFWVADWGSDSLYRFDGASGAPLDTIPAPSHWPGGLAWDGADLWVTDYTDTSRVIQVDPADGHTLSSFPVMYSADSGALAWTGESFFFSSHRSDSGGDGDIHHYAPDGTHLGQFDSPTGSNEPAGLAWDGENLWAAVQGVSALHVLDPATGATRWTLPIGRGVGHMTIVDGFIRFAYKSSGNYFIGKLVP